MRTMIRLLLPLLIFLMLLTGCKHAQFTPKTHKGAQLIAGSSGGVTGMLKEYVVLDNGQVFISKGIKGEWKETFSLKRSVTRDLFRKADALNLGSKRFNHPGNMTYYLALKNPSRSYELKWGEAGTNPPEGVEALYQEIITLVNH